MATSPATTKPDAGIDPNRSVPGWKAVVPALILLLFLACVVSGCAGGRVYSHKTVPFTTDFNATPCDWYPESTLTASRSWHNLDAAAGYRLNRSGYGGIVRLTYDLYDVRWSSNAIGDIAKRSGIETICFADLETTSIMGVWNRYRIHVYGF
jgi:hypothetical protein